MIPIIDMHCDTAGLIYSRDLKAANAGKKNNGGMGYDFDICPEEMENGISFRRNSRMIDFEKMKQGGYMCQCFAHYVSKGLCEQMEEAPFDLLTNMLRNTDKGFEENSDLIRPALSGSDIEKNFKEGYMSGLKTVEEGLPYEGKLENLYKAYEMGVRKSTLTWNYENELGFSNLVDGKWTYDTERGLKKAGFDFILAMEEMGMIIDVSHLNDAGIRDILNTVRPSTPVIASHSNARAVCSHPRNLTDEFLKEMADHGGVTGINFCPAFLTDENKNAKSPAESYSRISDMIIHMKHIKKVAGIDMVAMGTDFDGTHGVLEIDNCSRMQLLTDAMEKAGFTADETEKVLYKNALRVYKEVLG